MQKRPWFSRFASSPRDVAWGISWPHISTLENLHAKQNPLFSMHLRVFTNFFTCLRNFAVFWAKDLKDQNLCLCSFALADYSACDQKPSSQFCCQSESHFCCGGIELFTVEQWEKTRDTVFLIVFPLVFRCIGLAFWKLSERLASFLWSPGCFDGSFLRLVYEEFLLFWVKR
jgi:hypothetical protein